MAALQEEVTDSLRLELAAKAFRHTAFYDSMVSRYLTDCAGAGPFPEKITLGVRHDGLPMRYGENPHQRAARYLDPLQPSEGLRPLGGHGKEISYNNWLDAEAAWNLACDLPKGACAIIKHGNPCGAAVAQSLGAAYQLAKASDPVSAFGGIVAFHGAIDAEAVEAMTEKGNFLEVVIATGWESAVLIERFRSRSDWASNCRFLVGSSEQDSHRITLRSIRGGVLIQDEDVDPGEAGWRVATERSPTEQEWAALRLQWRIVPHVKSNAIVVGDGSRLLGVGAGQMNRVQSVRLALNQAGDAARGAVLASDAFFPFPDSIETAAAAGIGAIIQPGGSKKDEAVVAAANTHGVAMVLTGARHFRH
jgi:phosphoribosylaminoimidazolecarboxamide formyltransferase/IMP cyclohydrolase